jgi:hypothetical protein
MSDDDTPPEGTNPETESILDGQTITKGVDTPSSTRDEK